MAAEQVVEQVVAQVLEPRGLEDWATERLVLTCARRQSLDSFVLQHYAQPRR